jgi:hypothetical protein
MKPRRENWSSRRMDKNMLKSSRCLAMEDWKPFALMDPSDFVIFEEN